MQDWITGETVETAKGYEIIDGQTGQTMARRRSRIAATRKADDLDNEYGAVRYYVKAVRS